MSTGRGLQCGVRWWTVRSMQMRLKLAYGSLFLVAFGCDANVEERDAGRRDAGADSGPVMLCTRAADCPTPDACVDVSCRPGDPAADPSGCVEEPRCAADETCRMGRCVPVCETPDADRDGDPAIACGGGDCDDDDGTRSSMKPEICDDAGVDEDCDPTTVAGAADGDADGDDLIDYRCFNVRDDGTENHGVDCDQDIAGTGLGSVEHCGTCGDECGLECVEGACELPAQLALGGAHSCMLTDLGRVWCWGSNERRQFADVSPSSSTSPVLLSGLPSQVGLSCATTDGDSHGCVAWEETSVTWTWGAGRSPAFVSSGGPFGAPAASAVAVGANHECRVTADRRVYCSGDNRFGAVGTGTSGESMAVAYVAGLSDVVGVDVSNGHSCAVTAAGEVLCWGQNSSGEVGTDPAGGEIQATPVRVSALSGALSVAVGDDFSCALMGGGTVECWGSNRMGQLGDGADAGHSTCMVNTFPFPTTWDCSWTPVRTLLTNIVALDAGSVHACAIDGAGEVRCWGCLLYTSPSPRDA